MRHPAQLDLPQLLADCQVARTRRSGPGGQHRNKVETAIVITHLPTGIMGQASERRSQAENRDVALMRLRINLAVQVRYSICEDYAPSPLWHTRLRGSRLVISAQHSDFPAILAEALDVLAASGYEAGIAAEKLGCTATQFVKLLSLERHALDEVNRQRKALGKHSFHPRFP